MSRNLEFPDKSMHSAYIYAALGDSHKCLDMSTIFVEFSEIWKYGILSIMELHYGNRILLWNIHTYSCMSVDIHTLHIHISQIIYFQGVLEFWKYAN